jgi:serine/threonine-protein kinase
MDVSQEQGMVPTMSVAALASRKSASETTLELLRHETLGEYEILAELGRGGMATVYLAHHIALERKVAIKVMAPALIDEGLAERFRREARTAAALNHPHIIPIYGVYERSSLLYFVMKFVAGQSLDPILRKLGHLPVKMARTILAQAASALGYAHRRGVIHRDVKPANIMIDDEGWVVMTDFGIAKAPSATGLTLTGVTVGTPAYMSPEQCLGKEVTGASDQYSLGVVAYELLTGRKPFTAATAMAMMYAHFNEEPTPLREIRPDIPEDLEATVLRLLAKDPEKRWPRIDDAFGTPVLAHDDPARLQLIELAQAGPNATMAAQLSTPTSPIPPARRTSVRLPVSPSTTEPVLPAGARIEPPTTDAPAKPKGEEALAPTGAVAGASPPEAAAAEPAPGEAIPPVPAASAPSVVPRTLQTSVTTTAAPARKASATVLEPRPARRRISMAWVAAGCAAVVVGALVVQRITRQSAGEPAAAVSPTDSLRTTVATDLSDSLKVLQHEATVGPSSDPTRGSKPEQPAPPTPVAVGRIEVQPGQSMLEIGGSLQLEALLKSADGAPITDGREVVWKSSAPSIASVTGAGAVRALRVGKATITATAEGNKATAIIMVRPGATQPTAPLAVAAIRIVPETASVVVGRDQAFVAILRDTKGAQLGDRAVTWSVSPDSVASILPGGRLLGRVPGVARIVARSEAVSGVAIVTVIAEPVASVKLSAPAGPLKPGESIQLVATATAATGGLLEGRRVVWGTSDSTVATVAGGRVTAHAPGNVEITATIEGQRRAVTVSVSAPPPAPDRPNPAEEERHATLEIVRLMEAFVQALNSRDMKRVRDAYPGMSPGDEAKWRQMLEEKTVTKVRAVLQESGQPRVEGDAAESLVQLRLSLTVQGLTNTSNPKYRAVFRREGGAWHLMRLEDR